MQSAPRSARPASYVGAAVAKKARESTCATMRRWNARGDPSTRGPRDAPASLRLSFTPKAQGHAGSAPEQERDHHAETGQRGFFGDGVGLVTDDDLPGAHPSGGSQDQLPVPYRELSGVRGQARESLVYHSSPRRASQTRVTTDHRTAQPLNREATDFFSSTFFTGRCYHHGRRNKPSLQESSSPHPPPSSHISCIC